MTKKGMTKSMWPTDMNMKTIHPRNTTSILKRGTMMSHEGEEDGHDDNHTLGASVGIAGGMLLLLVTFSTLELVANERYPAKKNAVRK